MKEGDAGNIEIRNPAEIEVLIETLTLPGAASVTLDQADAEPLPVVVVATTPGESVTLDVTAIREWAAMMQRGEGVRLLGQGVDGMLRTPALPVRGCEEVGGRLYCYCDYPAILQQFQRRENFRAILRLGMHVGVVMRDSQNPVAYQGDLRDLSMDGCRVELPPNVIVAIAGAKLELELCFPSGTRFVIAAEPRHTWPDSERGVLSVGFAFTETSPDQDRQLWFYVREIERESARCAGDDTSSLQPSPLFPATGVESTISLRNALSYATPMARRLARIAGYLDNQALELRDGRPVNPVSLSKAAEHLLGLHDENREALLFAAVCMSHEPPLVQHSIAVAVRMVDIACSFRMPRELLKALAACALLHDLGKVLLPRGVIETGARSPELEHTYREHAALLEPRLKNCQWLSSAAREAVLMGANERLDGSGYPNQWRGDQLHELTRLTAVVVEVDRLGRRGHAEAGCSIEQIRRRLMHSEDTFDVRWVERYFSHFGRLPVGTPLRFVGGEMGWVCGLDERGEPGQVRLTAALVPPGDELGDVVAGADLARLGAPQAVAPPPATAHALYV